MATHKARCCSNCFNCRTVKGAPGFCKCDKGHFTPSGWAWGHPWRKLANGNVHGPAAECLDFENE